MKICVLGAGVVGVSTAFALSRLGHEVEVIDRADCVASGASHANGAQLSWSHTDPMASPAILGKLPAFLVGLDPAMRIHLSLKPNFLGWGLSFLRHCTPSLFEGGRRERHQLAEDSRLALSEFECDFAGAKMRRTGIGKIVLAQTLGQQRAMLQSEKYHTAEQCVEIEPALKSWGGNNLGGLYAPDDCALDTVYFCTRLKDEAETKYGTKFRFGETIHSISTKQGRIDGVTTETGHTPCDAVIVCLGNDVNALVRSLGLSVPICSVRGYSVTLPAKAHAPKASLTDLTHKIVFANLGDKIRIAGFADINALQERSARRVETLIDIARNCWPDIADYEAEPSAWTGARPMTPSGIPVIGPTSIEGLFLNAGHGSLGYTFAAGSAQRIANQIGGPS